MASSFRPLTVTTGPVDERAVEQLVLGRDKLVQSFWAKLQSGSLRMLAERRMGKTWVMNLALARKPDWAAPALFDAERPGTASEFVMQLNESLHRKGLIPDDWVNSVRAWFRRMFQRVQGEKIGPVSIPDLDPWDTLLVDTCRQFVQHSGQRQAVLMVDELPFFLDKLIKAERAPEAIQFLDTFRALRHELSSLRMVFCGSLGLHIVLSKLHAAGYTGQPVNDMLPFAVPPLNPGDASYLAGCLLTGMQVGCTALETVAQAVGQGGCGVPFYIQRIVSWMSDHNEKPWTPKRAGKVPHTLFHEAGDPAEFHYYDNRLDQYYPEDMVEKARASLDVLCRRSAGLTFSQALNEVRHNPKTLTTDDEQLRKVLGILSEDHYLVNDDDSWRFKLEIVRQWWLDQRGGV